LTFYINYGPVLYYFRYKARYWSKIAIFQTPQALHATPSLGGPHLNIATMFGIEQEVKVI